MLTAAVTTKAVIGIYKDRSSLEIAVAQLKREGFNHADVSVLIPDEVASRNLAHEKHSTHGGSDGATAGAGTGAILGGALGWLAGIGAIAIPALGSLIAAGPILSTMAGIGLGGAIGGVSGGLIGMGITELEARRFEDILKEGRILLSIHSEESSEIKKAERILEQTGASDITKSFQKAMGHLSHIDGGLRLAEKLGPTRRAS